MTDNVIEIKNLSKKYEEYGEFKLDNINISLPKGTVMGLIGENGAGKTTTIKLILNQLQKDDGSIKIFGLDSVDDEISIKDNIGVVFAENHFHENFTPEMIGNIMKNVYSKWNSQTYKEYLDKFNLDEYKSIGEMSHGMKMKVALAVALSHDAKLLILDEATSGLDPVARAELIDTFYDFISDGEHSILFSTHITSDLDRIADYITYISDGKIVLSVSKEEINESYGILKCKREDLAKIPQTFFIGKREKEFTTEVLIEDRARFKAEFPDSVIDNVIVEDIMTYIKGKDDQ